MPLERRRVEAWVNDLGKLEVEIPRSLGGLDVRMLIAQHPHQREKIEEAAERSAGLRSHAEAVIGEIYAHFYVGSPSSWGLIVSLRALASHLEESLVDDDEGPETE